MDAAANASNPAPGLAIPVAPGTVVVVDAASQLSAEHLVAAAVALLPSLAPTVEAPRLALGTHGRSALPWPQQLTALTLPPGALALLQRVLRCLEAAGAVGLDAGTLDSLLMAAVVVDAIGPARWVCPSVPAPWAASMSGTGLSDSWPASMAHLCMGAVLRTDPPTGARTTPD